MLSILEKYISKETAKFTGIPQYRITKDLFILMLVVDRLAITPGPFVLGTVCDLVMYISSLNLIDLHF